MLLKIDFQSEIPIYQQLKTQIIEGMATKTLKPGEPLPSVRQLAQDLGVNMHTVNKAYNSLKQDGFITIHRQKGVVINSATDRQITTEYLDQLRRDLRPLIANAFWRGIDEAYFQQICQAIISEIRNGGELE